MWNQPYPPKFVALFGVFLTIGVLFILGCGGESFEKKLKDAHSLNDKAQAQYDQHEFLDALGTLQKAMSMNGELQQDSAFADNLVLLGLLHRQLGQYDSALITFRDALARAHAMSNSVVERKGKVALADFLAAMRDNADAASLASDAATSSKFSSDWGNLYSSLLIASTAYHGLGQERSELRTLEELVQLDNRGFNSRHAQLLFGKRMDAFAAEEMIDSVRAAFQQWLQYARLAGDSLSVARAHIQWGLFKQTIHQYDSSFHSLSRALDLLNVYPDPVLQRQVLCSLGNLAFRQRNFYNANRYYKDAAEMTRKEAHRSLELLIDVQLVACDLFLNNSHDKQFLADLNGRCEAIADTCTQIGFRKGRAMALFVIGELAERRNEIVVSLKLYQQALELDEQNLLPDDEPEERDVVNSFMEGAQTGWYDALLQSYCSVVNAGEAFRLAERKNLRDCVRFFLQLKLATSNDMINRKIAEVQWKRAALSLLEQGIVQELSGGKEQSVDRLKALQDLYPIRLNDLSESENELSTVSPTFQWLVRLNPLSLKEIQEKLPENTALVEFVPSPRGLYIIAVKKDSTVLRSVSVNRQYLFSLVEEYNTLIADSRFNGEDHSFNRGGALSRLNKLSQMLYTLLIDPIRPYLVGATKLCIVSPKEFDYLPFHTLRTYEGGRPIVIARKFNISYLPSAAALLFPAPPQKVVQNVVGLGCAGTTSWDVEYELKDIRAFYEKATLLFDTAATLEGLASTQYDILHMAAEFSLDTARPCNSYAILFDRAMSLQNISLGKLLAIPTPPAFVFSNVSFVPGGLFRYAPLALLANGTQTLIATMWQGERKAKKCFGEIFYTNLHLGGSVSAAYHQAILALNNREEFSQLYRWGLYYRFGR